jgi:hypothetical protein
MVGAEKLRDAGLKTPAKFTVPVLPLRATPGPLVWVHAKVPPMLLKSRVAEPESSTVSCELTATSPPALAMGTSPPLQTAFAGAGLPGQGSS